MARGELTHRSGAQPGEAQAGQAQPGEAQSGQAQPGQAPTEGDKGDLHAPESGGADGEARAGEHDVASQRADVPAHGPATNAQPAAGAQLPEGSVVTASGRISTARTYQPSTPIGIFTSAQLSRIDEALTLSSRQTGCDFSVYLGELGADSTAGAGRLFDRIESRSQHAVLVAISPGERVVEIISGHRATQRITERGLNLAVMSMVGWFTEGDLAGGIVTGLRMLADQAGSAPA